MSNVIRKSEGCIDLTKERDDEGLESDHTEYDPIEIQDVTEDDKLRDIINQK